MYRHAFIRISDRYDAWELQLSDDAPEGLIDHLSRVCPDKIPDNEVLIYQWMPPRKDKAGNPTESKRLRFFRVPVGKGGPMIATIASILNDEEVPDEVRMPEPIVIPTEFQNASLDKCGTYAARFGLKIPPGADVKVIRVLLAREALTPRGKPVMERIRSESPPAHVQV